MLWSDKMLLGSNSTHKWGSMVWRTANFLSLFYMVHISIVYHVVSWVCWDRGKHEVVFVGVADSKQRLIILGDGPLVPDLIISLKRSRLVVGQKMFWRHFTDDPFDEKTFRSLFVHWTNHRVVKHWCLGRGKNFEDQETREGVNFTNILRAALSYKSQGISRKSCS